MKIIKILIFIILLSGCSNLGKNISEEKKIFWTEARDARKKIYKLRIGDIIVKNRVLTSITSWFGHAAVVISPWTIGEYPMIGEGFVQYPVFQWLDEDRKIAVLRYRYMTKEFSRRFLLNVKKYSDRDYKITLDKNNSNEFYCSQYVWFLYYHTAKEVKDPYFDYDFKKNDKLILPYDLLELPNFDMIDLR
ncbi:YiiX/YebB-like N1pC/P60 family cysteine hydrolase [Fusobacterium sp.]|uniref:YiiX/YebB-like N1pC/P60 family cysteine hydrolase n=1 Tax=Fusobacterium sp. TaxID=68766 RepID=UPI00396C755B